MLIKLEFSQQIKKNTNITFHKNRESSCSKRTHGGRTDGQTDITKLIVVFRNFANVPIKHDFCKITDDKTEGSHG
jgi:hypothetical protein